MNELLEVSDEKSDEELFYRYRDAQDHDAFKQLYLRHKNRLVAIALRRGFDKWTAQDLAHDALSVAVRKRQTFELYRSFGAWLYGILCKEMSKMRRSMIRDASTKVHYSRNARRLERDRDDRGLLCKEELLDKLLDEVQNLREDQRQLIEFRLNKLPYSEIAKQLKCEEANVRQIYHRTVILLREKLSTEKKCKIRIEDAPGYCVIERPRENDCFELLNFLLSVSHRQQTLLGSSFVGLNPVFGKRRFNIRYKHLRNRITRNLLVSPASFPQNQNKQLFNRWRIRLLN